MKRRPLCTPTPLHLLLPCSSSFPSSPSVAPSCFQSWIKIFSSEPVQRAAITLLRSFGGGSYIKPETPAALIWRLMSRIPHFIWNCAQILLWGLLVVGYPICVIIGGVLAVLLRLWNCLWLPLSSTLRSVFPCLAPVFPCLAPFVLRGIIDLIMPTLMEYFGSWASEIRPATETGNSSGLPLHLGGVVGGSPDCW